MQLSLALFLSFFLLLLVSIEAQAPDTGLQAFADAWMACVTTDFKSSKESIIFFEDKKKAIYKKCVPNPHPARLNVNTVYNDIQKFIEMAMKEAETTLTEAYCKNNVCVRINLLYIMLASGQSPTITAEQQASVNQCCGGQLTDQQLSAIFSAKVIEDLAKQRKLLLASLTKIYNQIQKGG